MDDLIAKKLKIVEKERKRKGGKVTKIRKLELDFDTPVTYEEARKLKINAMVKHNGFLKHFEKEFI